MLLTLKSRLDLNSLPIELVVDERLKFEPSLNCPFSCCLDVHVDVHNVFSELLSLRRQGGRGDILFFEGLRLK